MCLALEVTGNPPARGLDPSLSVGMPQSIERLHLTIDGVSHALAPMESVAGLKADVLAATRAGGGFLDVTVDGGQRLSIFITARTSITIVAATVRMDTGNADGRSRAREEERGAVYLDDETSWDGF